MLFRNAVCGFACLALLLLNSTPSFSAPMVVTMLPSGKLVAQNVLSVTTRQATSGEVSSWKRHSPFLSTKSPDGLYKVQTVKMEDQGVTVFRVIRERDRQVILDTKVMRHLIDDESDCWLYFNGWIPGSTQVCLSTDSHNSSDDSWKHGIVDVVSHRLITFNGFMSPNRRYAIVPGKPGRIGEDFQHYEVERGHRVETEGNIRWYVSPLPRNIAAYHFSSTRSRPMLLEGKPFAFFYEIITQMSEEDPTKQRPALSFSPDGQWAICHASHYVSQLQRVVDVDYLVSMTTGAMRKLPGSQTRFL